MHAKYAVLYLGAEAEDRVLLVGVIVLQDLARRQNHALVRVQRACNTHSLQYLETQKHTITDEQARKRGNTVCCREQVTSSLRAQHSSYVDYT